MTGLLRRIPYALKKTRKELIAAVAKKNSHDARICIERFVDALYEIPNGREELRRRATLIESLAGAGSDYEISRAQALPSYRGQPRTRSRSQIAIGRLRKSVGTPLFLVEVTRDRRDIEWVLEGGDLNLTPTARQAYKSWHNACRAIEKKAGLLEVDGCWYLFHVHQAGEINPSQYAENARIFIQVKSGIVNLESAKSAANSLVDWVGNDISRKDIGGGKTGGKNNGQTKNRGRPKADKRTLEREAELAAQWKRAKESRVYKPDFAKDNGMTTKDFDALLDRVNKRKVRSEK